MMDMVWLFVIWKPSGLYNINHPNSEIKYFNCSNYKGSRGTCEKTHYIRVDSIEQVVMAELQCVAQYLIDEEEEFAAVLEEKTNNDIASEQKRLKASIAASDARLKEIERLYERVYATLSENLFKSLA